MAGKLARDGFATLLLDLLVLQEVQIDAWTRNYRHDINRLAKRLVNVTRWARRLPSLRGLQTGLFVTDTAAVAGLHVAAEQPHAVAAIVSVAGKHDQFTVNLAAVKAAVLLIEGEQDPGAAARQQHATAGLESATHCKAVLVPGTARIRRGRGACSSGSIVQRLAANLAGTPGSQADERPRRHATRELLGLPKNVGHPLFPLTKGEKSCQPPKQHR